MNSIFAFVILAAMVASAMSQATCPNGENFAPCTCPSTGVVECSGVSVSEIQAIFGRTTPSDLVEVDMTLPSNDLNIPADLLGDHRVVDEIYVRCDRTAPQAITINRDAFRTSSSSALKFEVYYCDLTQLDWTFLTGFNQLSYLAIEYLSTVNQGLWATLPALPSLTTLEVYQCPTGVNEWTNFPTLTNGLVNFYLNADNLEDAAAERILAWISTSSAATLQTLDISSNKLTRIPTQVNSFTSLINLDLTRMQLPGLQALTASSTSFTAPVMTLLLDTSGITSITGAFQGNFAGARVTLQDNSLTRLESSVFQPMLTEMAAGSGTLDFSRNPLDCTTDICQLKWIVVDNPSLLAPLGGTASCSDGTYIENLPASSFAQCP